MVLLVTDEDDVQGEREHQFKENGQECSLRDSVI